VSANGLFDIATGLALGTAIILSVNFVLAAALCGIGLIVRRLFVRERIRFDDLFLAFWVGYAFVLLFLILWNFFLPVGGGICLALVLTAGALGLFGARGSFRDEWSTRRAGVLLFFCAGILFLVNQSISSVSSWDSNLYHWQGVRWATEHRVTPGLANLYGGLGFNNASFLFAGMIEAGPLAGRSGHFSNGILVMVMFAQIVYAGARYLDWSRSEGGEKWKYLFALFLLTPLAGLANEEWMASYVTDLPQNLLLMAATICLFSVLSGLGSDSEQAAYRIVAVVALLAAAVTVKLSAVIYAAAAGLVAIGLWLHHHGLHSAVTRKMLRWSATLAAGFALAWTARGVILSGYPFFPMPVAGMPVDWRVPLEHAQAEYDYIVYSALEMSWAWFPNWTRRLWIAPYDLLIPLSLAAIGFILIQRTDSAKTRAVRQVSWLIIPLLAAIIGWLLAAPDPRYITSITWSVAALSIVQFVRTRGELTPRRARLHVAAAVALGLSPLVVKPLIIAARQQQSFNPIAVVLEYNLNRPGPDWGLHTNGATVATSNYTTRSGLTLHVPEFMCSNAPLPCTPNPAPNLVLRRPESLDHGFRVNGGWQMLHWPQTWRTGYLSEWRAKQK
jgi:hypothetical protein